MNKLTIAEQIRTLRKSKGLSQEALAQQAGINLRTLQRIEAGNAEPRGETVRLLARALEVPIESLSELDSLSELIEKPHVPVEEDLGFLKLMNLSALSFWVFPFGNILLPLGFWIYRKNKIAGVKELGKRILNVQIAWAIIVYGLAFFTMLGGMWGLLLVDGYLIDAMMVMKIILFLYVANSIFIIASTFKITKGEEDVYSTSLKIIQ
ncbi:MAG: helix-turn-helix domain-containing protein [Dyadobacter sp.]|uniref:helix-turn-helix domain-containing protein n=1 Tax=Dyadobacter sp. TaxID=1914288 RepID=UPI003267731D